MTSSRPISNDQQRQQPTDNNNITKNDDNDNDPGASSSSIVPENSYPPWFKVQVLVSSGPPPRSSSSSGEPLLNNSWSLLNYNQQVVFQRVPTREILSHKSPHNNNVDDDDKNTTNDSDDRNNQHHASDSPDCCRRPGRRPRASLSRLMHFCGVFPNQESTQNLTTPSSHTTLLLHDKNKQDTKNHDHHPLVVQNKDDHNPQNPCTTATTTVPQLVYQDEEGDWIWIRDSHDLDQALVAASSNNHNNKKSLKLVWILPSPPPNHDDKTTPKTRTTNQTTHSGMDASEPHELSQDKAHSAMSSSSFEMDRRRPPPWRWGWSKSSSYHDNDYYNSYHHSSLGGPPSNHHDDGFVEDSWNTGGWEGGWSLPRWSNNTTTTNTRRRIVTPSSVPSKQPAPYRQPTNETTTPPTPTLTTSSHPNQHQDDSPPASRGRSNSSNNNSPTPRRERKPLIIQNKHGQVLDSTHLSWKEMSSKEPSETPSSSVVNHNNDKEPRQTHNEEEGDTLPVVEAETSVDSQEEAEGDKAHDPVQPLEISAASSNSSLSEPNCFDDSTETRSTMHEKDEPNKKDLAVTVQPQQQPSHDHDDEHPTKLEPASPVNGETDATVKTNHGGIVDSGAPLKSALAGKQTKNHDAEQQHQTTKLSTSAPVWTPHASSPTASTTSSSGTIPLRGVAVPWEPNTVQQSSNTEPSASNLEKPTKTEDPNRCSTKHDNNNEALSSSPTHVQETTSQPLVDDSEVVDRKSPKGTGEAALNGEKKDLVEQDEQKDLDTSRVLDEPPLSSTAQEPSRHDAAMEGGSAPALDHPNTSYSHAWPGQDYSYNQESNPVANGYGIAPSGHYGYYPTVPYPDGALYQAPPFGSPGLNDGQDTTNHYYSPPSMRTPHHFGYGWE